MTSSAGHAKGGMLRHALLAVLASLTLLWPAAINGGPFWFPDTSNYIRAADAARALVTGIPSEWSDRIVITEPGPETAARDAAENAGADAEGAAASVAEGAAGAPVKSNRPILAGRSIYYGMLIHLPMLALGPWGAALLQALIAGGVTILCTALLLRRFAPRFSDKSYLIVPLLAAVTPMGYYASMLMPDIYSGLIILVMATLIATYGALSRSERLVLIALAAGMVTFHTTHLLLVLSVAGVAALLALFEARKFLRPILIGGGVAAFGILSMVAFSQAVSMSTGQSPMSPPFLTARLMDNGPGVEFLERKCTSSGEQPWALCAYRDRLPLHSDAFLWNQAPRPGLFQQIPLDEQRAIANDDKRLFIAIALDDPLRFIATSLKSTGEQLAGFGLDNFNYHPRNLAKFLSSSPAGVASEIEQSRAAQGTMPISATIWLSVASALAGIGAIAFLLLRRGSLGEGSEDLRHWALLIVLGVLANAAICGALSGPHDRYQMRLIWLLPMAAGVLLASRQAAQPGRSTLPSGSPGITESTS